MFQAAIDALGSMGDSQKQHLVQQQQQLLQLAQQQQKISEAQSSQASLNDKYFVVGKAIGENLKSMSPEQFQISQVLINTILFLGNTNRLTPGMLNKILPDF